jgi:methionyl-tRNA formyltransferase
MRIIFAACAGIAVCALEAMFAFSREKPDFELVAVLTNPDSAKGRSAALIPTEIGIAAQRLRTEYAVGGIQPVILKPDKLDSEARNIISMLKPDLLVSFAYGSFFGPKFLGLFPQGGINIHPSLLPEFRGPAPIPAAIIAGKKDTGISFQRLSGETDCGDILIQERIFLNGRETCGSLSDLMAKKAAQMLPGVLTDIKSGFLPGEPQNHADASYCFLILKEQGLIDWNKSAAEIDAQIRAYDPWPLSLTIH